MDKVPSARIRQLCGVTKGVDERNVERMENDSIAKRVYVGECAGIRSVCRPWKRWVDTVKGYLKKTGSDVRHARRMVHDRSVWRVFVEGMHGVLPG